MFQFRAAIFAALFLLVAIPPGFAQDVTLTSRDGTVEISGTLLGFDGEFYRVETVYGELTVDGTGVKCDGPGCPRLTDYVADITIAGAASMGEVLMPALLEAFALRNGFEIQRMSQDVARFEYLLRDGTTGALAARFRFHASSSDEGFADLLADEADIAMSLREIREHEAKRGYEAGLGDMRKSNRSRVLALDGLVPLVSPGNPVRMIAPDTLARVFAGQIDNWSDLGGPDAPIALHLMNGRSGQAQAAEDQLMAPAGLTWAEGITRHARNDAMVSAVLRDPFAIAIGSYAEPGNTQVLTLTGGCGFSLSASRRTIKTEDYPLTAPMFLYLPARRLPKIARDFLAYTRGPSAQIVIRRAGFVDQAPEEIPVTLQGDRLANAIASAGTEVSLEELQRMVQILVPRNRLSISFRFLAGSSDLDAQSRSNIHQLAHAIEAGEFDAREIVFAGFSDGNGAASANREIARERAEAVRDAVMSAAETASFDSIGIKVVAFGEALPMACNDSAWGRQANRRVEVWVR